MLTTLISPVPVFPGEANTLALRSITLGPPPSYYYELQQVTPTPPQPEQVDPTTGEVIAPAVPAGVEVVVLKNGNVNMTEQQWNDWAAGLGPQGDDEYQLDCISANLGLTRA